MTQEIRNLLITLKDTMYLVMVGKADPEICYTLHGQIAKALTIDTIKKEKKDTATKKLTKKQRICIYKENAIKLTTAYSILQTDLRAAHTLITKREQELKKALEAKANWKHITTYNGGEVKAALELLTKALGFRL